MTALCVFVVPQDSSPVAADKLGEQDVVLIKEETPKEEVNDEDAMDELLLNEDGKTSCRPFHIFRSLTDCFLS